jgi:tRNA threonylcarbamoyladenosine biosynthesis protein TsaB
MVPRVGAETKREHAAITVRAFVPSDAAAVAGILKESPQAADWTEASVRDSAGWRGSVVLVSERDGKVSGFLIGRQVADQAEILNLAVSLAKRGKGEGGALLKVALNEFRARRVGYVFLEVRESNQAAISFYAKHGFSQRDIRLKYYRNPEEAAVVMEKKLAL